MEKGFLFVHGIQGSLAQFIFLTERLPEDIRVRNLLLPGHGAVCPEQSPGLPLGA